MRPEDFTLQIEQFQARSREIAAAMTNPDVYSQPAKMSELSRENTRLEHIFSIYDAWKNSLDGIAENNELLKAEADSDFCELLKEDIKEKTKIAEESAEKFILLLVPPEKTDSRNAIVEIKPAVGGEEAALFAADLYHVYLKFAELKKWKVELLDQSQTELGGLKNVMFQLSGTDIFSQMKFECGVHRVQRIPVTEAGGRIHTSTVTVSVLPEADELDDIDIRPEDLEVSTYHSSGPGGQKVNKTSSAVRIKHLPSGFVVACQQERSQIRNREIAMRILRSHLLEISRNEEAKKQSESKRIQVGTGDRSERIRTYNFPQNRVTDHRFGVVSVYDLPSIMEGNLDLLLEPLFKAHSQSVLEELLKDNN